MNTRNPQIRILTPGYEALLERFLLPRKESSLFLLSNLRRAGLSDHGQRGQGTYFAALEDGEVVAVVGHFWNGNIIVQAPEYAAALTAAARRATGRPLARLLGPADQVESALRGLPVQSLEFDAKEILYGLYLENMAVPVPLQAGQVRARVVQRRDAATVSDWRAAMSIEQFHEEDTPELRANAAESVENSLRSGRRWVLEDANGQLVSMCDFNAELAEVVQVGGVFTPPERRRRGYARAVVAAALMDARAEGVTDAILFTEETNTPARKAYEALGFQAIGDYRITRADLPPVGDMP
ncbi:MAG: GNAT family N-acetyltransferase [Anaerolineae bacterium]|nr:GNAT family N-acetyltransferase [Anaerolineae bacterium]